MATFQEFKDKIAAERQQHLDAIAAKDQTIAEKDAEIADLKNQLANAVTPAQLDELAADVDTIVP